MDRHLVGVATTITAPPFTDANGTAVDPGPVTIGITRADGTVLVAPLTATAGTGVTPRTYAASAADMALLDVLEVTWTSATLGALTSTVEVVGGFLFTIAEAKALAPLDQAGYTISAVAAMRTLVEQALEQACGVAFVPRYELETINGHGTTTLITRWPKVTAVRSASIAGTALTGAQLGTVVPTGTGSIYYPGRWTAGFGNVILGYEHGYATAPARVSRAALRLAKRWLVEGPVDDRATTFSTDEGTFSLVTPGRRGDLFDLPEVNAVVQQYSLNFGIA